jgi:CHU_C Type IX secretion signal domain
MKRMILFMAVTLIPLTGISQLVISAGTDVVAATGTTLATTSRIENQSLKTDFTNLKLVLAATGTAAQGLVNGTLRPLPVGSITINSNATFALAGEWLVKNEMIFTKGKLVVDKFQAIPGKLGYQGTTPLVGNDDSYVNGRIFMLSQAAHTFPIGNNDGYFPAQLTINDADAADGVGMEIVSTNPGFAPVTGSIKEIFTDHFWELTAGTSGTLNSSNPISLSSNGTSNFFTGDGDAVVLESNSSGVQANLGGIVNNTFYSSTQGVSSKAKTFGLAKSDKISVIVHKLITPDNDEKNDVLFIDGIDSFPENEVYLLDRWGKEIRSWESFQNYPQPAISTQANFDFSKLEIGNYICVVKFVRNGKEETINQMIAVLK